MKTINYSVVIVALFLFFASCKKNEEQATIYLGYDYFPVNVGHELYYDADSTITDEFTSTTRTHHFQIKEVIASTFLDNEGRTAERIERYVRDSSNAPWGIFKVSSVTLTNTRVERYDDNVRYVKLVFPVKQDVHWNGNSLNTMEALDYQYMDVNNAMTLNNQQFDSALTVLQQDVTDLIERKYFSEQYAAQVGMIYKENINQTIDFNLQTVKSGYIYKETLTSYTP